MAEYENWVPLYYEGGVTIGRAKLNDDMTSMTVELNEGSEVGRLIQNNLIGFSTMSIASNPAQELEVDDGEATEPRGD